MPHHITRRAQI